MLFKVPQDAAAREDFPRSVCNPGVVGPENFSVCSLVERLPQVVERSLELQHAGLRLLPP